MRLFVGLALPEPVRWQLGLLCTGLPGVRWVPPENFHITLRFIGEVDGGTLHDVDAALAGIRAPRAYPLVDAADDPHVDLAPGLTGEVLHQRAFEKAGALNADGELVLALLSRHAERDGEHGEPLAILDAKIDRWLLSRGAADKARRWIEAKEREVFGASRLGTGAMDSITRNPLGTAAAGGL